MRKYILLIVLGLLSCKKKTIDAGNNAVFDIQKNVRYGTSASQIVDLYLPKNVSELQEVFLFVHGGGWKGGSKTEFNALLLRLMKHYPNAIFANMNYRLASNKTFALPLQTDDINTVIDLIQKKTGEAISKKIVLVGNSSGAHISMMYALHFDEKKQIKAVVNIVGPSDLNDDGFKTYFDYEFVRKHLINPALVPEGISPIDFASPVFWVKKSDVPIIAFYGSNDFVVPISQKRALDSAFAKTNLPYQSFDFKGGHSDWHSEENSKMVIAKTTAFLDALH